MRMDESGPMIGRWGLAWRLARRELRDGLKGFRVLIACLVLGVASIAGVGSLGASLRAGLAEQGRVLLAGDLSVRSFQQPLSVEVLEELRKAGTVARTATLSTNIFAVANGERALAALKAVDDHYPLYGDLTFSPTSSRDAVLERRNGMAGIALAPELAERLKVHPGDRIRLGSSEFVLRALLVSEPDRINSGMRLGPTAMIDFDAAGNTGLLARGSLVTWEAKVRLPPDADPEILRRSLLDRFSDQGLRVTTRNGAAPAVRRFIDRFGHFLLLVGLTALLLGGVGVANAVTAWLERRRATIAVFKLLGADGAMVARCYLLAVFVLAAGAALAGVVIGAAVPWLGGTLVTRWWPVPLAVGLYPIPLAFAFAAGLAITGGFIAIPLSRAVATRAGHLFRGPVSGEESQASISAKTAALMLVVSVPAASVWLAERRDLAIGFVLGAGLSIFLLTVLAKTLQAVLRRLPRPRMIALRMALANLVRPGARTVPVMVSIGLGLTLFATLALVEGNLRRDISGDLSRRAPDFFFVDIAKNRRAAFEKEAAAYADRDGEGLKLVPSLRGTIIRLNGRLADPEKVSPDVRWVLRGDRGLSFSRRLPDSNRLVAGRWWPEDYHGPPLVSMSANEARGLGLDVGSTITLRVMGREITATVASLREVRWRSFGFNFVILFDPATLADAPFTWMATLRLADPDVETDAYRSLTDAFPEVTAVRVGDVLGELDAILARMAIAIRLTAALALIAGILVLAGALAAQQRMRLHEAAVLKTLGARRRDIARIHALEYLLLGALTGGLAFLVGGAAGWLVVTKVMNISFMALPGVVATTVLAGMGLVLMLGLGASHATLGVRPWRLLREA
ncbi:MAG: FtsX-like permease family protein [Alphaproteobacteria bacterium]|nr:MAG: FtsX-like permease family protein [Alphaproteobacteria bacterium]